MTHDHHHRDTSDPESDATRSAARREVIYYLKPTMPLAEVATLPYTDVIVAFLAPTEAPSGNTAPPLTLLDKDKAFLASLGAAIQTLHAAGKRVLVSLGGASFHTSAYAAYSKDVPALVGHIVVDWVEKYGFDGVDIDYEDSPAFYEPATTYNGKDFLVKLTRGLASQLPAQQRIITHAPQSPYWDPKWRNAGAPYREIWNKVGHEITWVNNQFYNNKGYDDTTTEQKDWYRTIASFTGAGKLLFGTNLLLDPKNHSYRGHWPVSKLVKEVIHPLRDELPNFGGVMGWQLFFDTDGSWGRAVAKALA
jgi:hypothetical protein